MLRISLIIAIVAGLAAAGLNFYKVQEVIKLTITERVQEKTAKEAAITGWNATKVVLKKTENDLSSTKKTLATTESNLKRETARANTQEKQAKELTAKLSKSESERDDAQRMLAQWKDVGVTPGQVKSLIVERTKLKEDKEILMQESKLLANLLRKKTAELAQILGPDERPPVLPVGLKGSVVAVDPKYDFVVLDIGGNQGVLERGEMLVNRNGKLVAKVKVFSVEPNRCIANILPNWKQSDVMEGDQVLY